ncbi:glycosyltransferase family 1 protein [Geitlerinema sp. PCC 9228]|uniref:glycosyltransferase family 4 protein n=1 Tax=Geitlerinema sp. PCC 9228 TaxID=111611 RepID=UPI0008F9D087|nr:glycosyltransferase family 1 protein [Geitlerinema sp. PCC 9228]
MAQQDAPSIALISVHGDPAIEIGKEEAGGQNVYVYEVGMALAQLGWQVDMFTRYADARDEPVVEHDRNCRTIRLVAGPKEFVPRDEIFDYLPEFVERLQQFQQENGRQYRLVHTNYWLSAWVGMELKRRQACQQVHTYHSLGAVKYQNVSDRPPIADTRLQVEKECLETAERIVATSPQEKEHMRSLLSEKGQIDIIPCGTDIHRFGHMNRNEARKQLNIAPDAKVLFYVGRFDPRKGIETMVRAASRSQILQEFDGDVHVIVGGGYRPGKSDGNERDRICGIATELGIDGITSFPGRIADEDLPTYYAAADVCVQPSHYEPFGLVAIEAMASGTPVVASNVGGLQFTVVSEETGLLCPPRDEVAFAQAIDRILADKSWRDRLGENARHRVESMFSWEGVAKQLSDLYAQLLEMPATTTPGTQ